MCNKTYSSLSASRRLLKICCLSKSYTCLLYTFLHESFRAKFGETERINFQKEDSYGHENASDEHSK